jgi:hypothetical protein
VEENTAKRKGRTNGNNEKGATNFVFLGLLIAGWTRTRKSLWEK